MQKNNKKIVLGINWEQNSSVALMIDGKIVEAISEERFSKLKNDERYPKLSIDYILKKYHIKNRDIDYVCFVSKLWSPSWMMIRRYTKFDVKDFIKEQNEVWYPRYYQNKKTSILDVFKNFIDLNQYPGKSFWKKYLKNIKSNNHVSNKKNFLLGQKIRIDAVNTHLKISKEKIKFFDHHLCHCAYGYFSGPLNNKRSLVFSLDAFGDNSNYSCHLFEPKKNYTYVKEITRGGNSVVARLYRYITLLLNMKPSSHEYKTMGLAAYANPKYYNQLLKRFKNIQEIQNFKFKFKKKPKDLYFEIKEMINGERFDSVAGAIQKFTEDIVLNWISSIINKYKIKDVCFSGGVAMNVKTNMLITNLKQISNFYVPPTPDDTSQCIGACYALYLERDNKYVQKRPHSLKNAYLGYDANNDEEKKFFSSNKINKQKFKLIKKDINKEAAKLLYKNKIIARISGRAEFGARALGNRSILANPSEFNNKSKINKSIKSRDFWMPFAASVLSDHSQKYFKIYQSKEMYKYMTNCVQTTDLGKEKLEAAIHPNDKTCRPQILTRENNFEYYDLIKEFGKISGVYALLNTSFNIHGMPIVNNIQDAFKVLKNTELDGILLPSTLIIKK